MNSFLTGLGIKTRTYAIFAVLVLLSLLIMAAADWSGFKERAPARQAEESRNTALQILETSAQAQCVEAIKFTNRRAEPGFNVVAHSGGDILIEQPFSVPVRGFTKPDEYTARCVLRKGGAFEFGVRRNG
jgi:hypothetical protein